MSTDPRVQHRPADRATLALAVGREIASTRRDKYFHRERLSKIVRELHALGLDQAGIAARLRIHPLTIPRLLAMHPIAPRRPPNVLAIRDAVLALAAEGRTPAEIAAYLKVAQPLVIEVLKFAHRKESTT